MHPPSVECNPVTGAYIRSRAICYVEDWYTGFAVLLSYKAGTYHPGDEVTIKAGQTLDEPKLDTFCRRILKDCRIVSGNVTEGLTFAEVYEELFEQKFGEHAPKKLSQSSRNSFRCGYKNLSAIHDRPIRSLTVDDLQKVLNDCTLKEASLELMITCMKQVYAYAESRDYVQKDISRFVVKPMAEGDEHGVPFSLEDIHRLWQLQSDPTAEFLLIMCYSGFRISAYLKMEINLDEMYFKGGVKTKAGKGRIVPIHPYIQPLVVRRLQRDGALLKTDNAFRVDMKNFLSDNDMEYHTPHDCRHTFSMLCERYGVNDADRKRMMGHSFGADITNGIYGHRTLEDLRAEICKITAR